jgi:chromosomal replication initiator protein
MHSFDDTSITENLDQHDEVDTSRIELNKRSPRIRAMLKAKLGDDVFSNWFGSLEFDSYDDSSVQVSVPVKFLRNWIQSHYVEELLLCCKAEFAGIERVDILVRTPAPAQNRGAATAPVRRAEPTPSAPALASPERRSGLIEQTPMMQSGQRNTSSAGGLEGSPLDPRYTFDTFVVGPSNRMAHAAATQAAETVLATDRGFNPLFLHSAVGLGKSHLLHAIAWDVKRRTPHAQVLYLTAERFLFQFVEAIRSQEAIAFKNKFRTIDILLIDDFEFMQGDKTEQEFEHIINALLDSGKQLVVASSRPPAQIERLNDRMRSRLQRGLVTDLQPLPLELRCKILEKRVAEKRAHDPLFALNRDILNLLAEKLTENGRELEGAINHLFHNWQMTQTAATLETAEAVMRSLVHGAEPRRIKIEDILKVVSRHYAVTRADIVSPRRHRSVVWPRQIGMYLAKHMTARSLPEIGRRFGDRDHTTVLHAIRKIDRELEGNNRLRDEIEALKSQLSRSV